MAGRAIAIESRLEALWHLAARGQPCDCHSGQVPLPVQAGPATLVEAAHRGLDTVTRGQAAGQFGWLSARAPVTQGVTSLQGHSTTPSWKVLQMSIYLTTYPYTVYKKLPNWEVPSKAQRLAVPPFPWLRKLSV